MSQERKNALAIIDTQRGFMPASEGARLSLEGFGELGVDGGEYIIERINRLTHAMAARATGLIVTTQDWHPTRTAHFSTSPDFKTTWPIHCVGGTPGAELHPDLLVAGNPGLATQFLKGEAPCLTPDKDTSYTGALARNTANGQLLPRYLQEENVSQVYVTGLALGDGNEYPLCVDSTSLDLQNAGFSVALVTDAVEAVLPQSRAICFENLAKKGIRLVSTEEALRELKEVNHE